MLSSKKLYIKVVNTFIAFIFSVTSTPCFAAGKTVEAHHLSPKSQNLLEIIGSGQEEEILAENLLNYYQNHDMAYEVLAGIKTSRISIKEKLNLQKQIQNSVETLKSEYASLQFYSPGSLSETDRQISNLIELLNMLKDRLHVKEQNTPPVYLSEELIQRRREAIFRNVLEKYNPYTLKESFESFNQGTQSVVFKEIRKALKSQGVIASNISIAEAMNREDFLSANQNLMFAILQNISSSTRLSALDSLKTGEKNNGALLEVKEALSLQFYPLEDIHLEKALTESLFASEKKLRSLFLAEFSPAAVLNVLKLYLLDKQAGNTLWQTVKDIVADDVSDDARLASALNDVWEIQKRIFREQLSGLNPVLLNKAIKEAKASVLSGNSIKKVRKAFLRKGFDFPLDETIRILASMEADAPIRKSAFNLRNFSLAGVAVAFLAVSGPSGLWSDLLSRLSGMDSSVLKVSVSAGIVLAAAGIFFYKSVSRYKVMKSGDLEGAYKSLSPAERAAGVFLPLLGLGLFIFLVIVPVFTPVYAATGFTLAVGTTLLMGGTATVGDQVENGGFSGIAFEEMQAPLIQVASADVRPTRDAVAVKEQIRQGFESGFSASQAETERFQAQMIEVYDQQNIQKASLAEMSLKLSQVGEEAALFSRNHPDQQVDLSQLEKQKKEFLRSYELNQIYTGIQSLHTKANKLVAGSNAVKGKKLGDYQNLLNALEGLQSEEKSLLAQSERLSKRGEDPPTFTWEKVITSTRQAMEEYQRNMNVTDEFNKAFDIDTYAQSPVYTVDYPALEKYWSGRLAEIPEFASQAEAVKDAFRALRISLSNRFSTDLEKNFRARNLSEVTSLLQYYTLHRNDFTPLLHPQNKALISQIESQVWILAVLERNLKERPLSQIQSGFDSLLKKEGVPDFRGASGLIEELKDQKEALDKFIRENSGSLLNMDINSLYKKISLELGRMGKLFLAKEKQAVASFQKDFSKKNTFSTEDYRVQTSNRLLELERNGLKSELLSDLQSYADRNLPEQKQVKTTEMPAIPLTEKDTTLDEISKMLSDFNPQAILDSLHKGMKTKRTAGGKKSGQVSRDTVLSPVLPLRHELGFLRDSLSSVQKNFPLFSFSGKDVDSLSRKDLEAQRLQFLGAKEACRASENVLLKMETRVDSLRIKADSTLFRKSASREAAELISDIDAFSGDLASALKNTRLSGEKIEQGMNQINERILQNEKESLEKARKAAEIKTAVSSAVREQDTLLIWEKELQTACSEFEKKIKEAFETEDLSFGFEMHNRLSGEAVNLLRQADSLSRLTKEFRGKLEKYSFQAPSETAPLLQQTDALSGRITVLNKALIDNKQKIGTNQKIIQNKMEKDRKYAQEQEIKRAAAEKVLGNLDERIKVSLGDFILYQKDAEKIRQTFSDLQQKKEATDLRTWVSTREGLVSLSHDLEMILLAQSSMEDTLALLRDSVSVHQNLAPDKAGLLLQKIEEQKNISSDFFRELKQTFDKAQVLTREISEKISRKEAADREEALLKDKALSTLKNISSSKDSLFREWSAFQQTVQKELRIQDELFSSPLEKSSSIEEIAGIEARIQSHIPTTLSCSNQLKILQRSFKNISEKLSELKPLQSGEVSLLETETDSVLEGISALQSDLSLRQQKFSALAKNAETSRNSLIKQANDKAKSAEKLLLANLKLLEEDMASLNNRLDQSGAAAESEIQYFDSTAQGIENNTADGTQALMDLYGQHIREIDSLLKDTLQTFSKMDQIKDSLAHYQPTHPTISDSLFRSLLKTEEKFIALGHKLEADKSRASSELKAIQATYTQIIAQKEREENLNREAKDSLQRILGVMAEAEKEQKKQLAGISILKSNLDSVMILTQLDDMASLRFAETRLSALSLQADDLLSRVDALRKEAAQKKKKAEAYKERALDAFNQLSSKTDTLGSEAVQISDTLQKMKQEITLTLKSVAQKQNSLTENARLKAEEAGRDSLKADSLARNLALADTILNTLSSQVRAVEDTLSLLKEPAVSVDSLPQILQAKMLMDSAADTLSQVGKMIESGEIVQEGTLDSLPQTTQKTEDLALKADSLKARMDSVSMAFQQAQEDEERRIAQEKDLQQQKNLCLAELNAQESLLKGTLSVADSLTQTSLEMMNHFQLLEKLSFDALSRDTLNEIKSTVENSLRVMTSGFEKSNAEIQKIQDTVSVLSDNPLIREEGLLLLEKVNQAKLGLENTLSGLVKGKILLLKKLNSQIGKIEESEKQRDSAVTVALAEKTEEVKTSLPAKIKKTKKAEKAVKTVQIQEEKPVEQAQIPSIDLKLNTLTEWMQNFFAPDATRVEIWKSEAKKILEGSVLWNEDDTDSLLSLLSTPQITADTLVDTAKSIALLNSRFNLDLSSDQQHLLIAQTLKLRFADLWDQTDHKNMQTLLKNLGGSVDKMYRDFSGKELDWMENEATLRKGFSELLTPLQGTESSFNGNSDVRLAIDDYLNIHIAPAVRDVTRVDLSEKSGTKNVLEMIFNYLKNLVTNDNNFLKTDDLFKGEKQIAMAA